MALAAQFELSLNKEAVENCVSRLKIMSSSDNDARVEPLDIQKHEGTMKILAVSGSLRSSSSNAAVLRAVAGLALDDMKISFYNRLGDLPHFNPEIDEDKALTTVSDWRVQLQQSDGVVFCTPEYAHGVPGVLKNALDWLVSSGEFMHKPTAVISASPSPDGGNQANASLVQTLKVMLAEIEGTLCIPAISARLNDKGEITDPALTQALQLLLDRLTNAILQKR